MDGGAPRCAAAEIRCDMAVTMGAEFASSAGATGSAAFHGPLAPKNDASPGAAQAQGISIVSATTRMAPAAMAADFYQGAPSSASLAGSRSTRPRAAST